MVSRLSWINFFGHFHNSLNICERYCLEHKIRRLKLFFPTKLINQILFLKTKEINLRPGNQATLLNNHFFNKLTWCWANTWTLDKRTYFFIFVWSISLSFFVVSIFNRASESSSLRAFNSSLTSLYSFSIHLAFSDNCWICSSEN